MAVTRSSAADRRTQPAHRAALAPRTFERMGLLAATILTLFGLYLVYGSVTSGMTDARPLNVNRLENAEQLLPALQVIPSAGERSFVARKVFEFVQTQGGKLPNVGALSRIRVSASEVSRAGRLEGLRARLNQVRSSDSTIALLTPGQIAQIKPLLAVRDLSSYKNNLLLWGGAFLLVFYLLHALLMTQRHSGDQAILPALHALTGIGLLLMVALRDPLRDTLSFSEFAFAVVLGAVAFGAAALVDWDRWTSDLSYTPLLVAIGFSIALILFGTGPGQSDAKVNLLGFQPVEAIKILLVFFLAGYFARRWEFLRVLKEKRPELARLSRHVEIPRLEYLMPVMVAVALTLVFFFLQKDLGPALILACLFLALYAVARNRALLASVGLLLMLCGFLAGYALGYPQTVYSRVSMWLSPWDNTVRGGEQVVHSLWAFATGGTFGTGLGLGDPEIMPAGHTDLILAVLGEELGFIGVLAVFALYALLAYTGLRIARHAKTDYAFFLALGLTLLITFEIILITGGVLDLTPLSGVVTPFLSFGGTAMIANFAIFGILLALSHRTGTTEHSQPFAFPVRRLAQLLSFVLLVILGKAAWIQIARADPVVGAGALTVQADGYRRYQYNPRLLAIARSIPRGNIFDRNGVPLAVNTWKDIEEHKQAYASLALPLDQLSLQQQDRIYPLGKYAVHMLGDLRTRANWGARNSSLIERDSMVRLQGYNDRATVVPVAHPRTGAVSYTIRYDLRELVPLLRHRAQPEHPEVLKVINRERDVQTTIDARLQVRTARILEARLKKLGRQKGAAVVMDPYTGDVLAAVSYPWPDQMPPRLGPDDEIDEMLDRARYGLYPPGSTFKIVTAIAALRNDPALAQQTYECKPLGDGRVGNHVRGWGRPIRDDVADRTAHGNVDMSKGTIVSCNAYYAQLGTYNVGADSLHDTASKLGITVAAPNTPAKLKDALPQAAYGQAQVVASPFQMARVAATIASGGNAPYGRWTSDKSNTRIDEPQPLLRPELARRIGEYMRGVVTSGTGRAVSTAPVPIAGKTGTAEVEKKASHAWFIGYAPYGGKRPLAFAVIVENGQYGGSAAAPIAGEIVAAASELGLFRAGEDKEQ